MANRQQLQGKLNLNRTPAVRQRWVEADRRAQNALRTHCHGWRPRWCVTCAARPAH